MKSVKPGRGPSFMNGVGYVAAAVFGIFWMIMAGGIGNCIDRILYGYVQDMFKVEFFNFPIFNVADICVCCGAVIAAAALLVQDAGGKKRTEGA